MKLIIPGLSDGSYDLCRRQLEDAEKLLVDAQGNGERLSGILQTFDKNAAGARLLEAEVGERYRRVYDQLIKISPRTPDLELKSGSLELTLDQQPADFGEKRTQEAWFDYWDKITDGRVMASMGNLYRNFKVLKRMSEQGTTEDKALAKRYLTSLLDDFDWPEQKNFLVSSTRVDYHPSNLSAKITQHYRSKQPELTKETNLLIRGYRDTPIIRITEDEDCLTYVQILLDTEDDPETIMGVLEFVSGKNRSQIQVWSAVTESNKFYTRKERPNRTAGFNYNYDNFHVNGNYNIDNLGRSRGVLVSPLSGRVKKGCTNL